MKKFLFLGLLLPIFSHAVELKLPNTLLDESVTPEKLDRAYVENISSATDVVIVGSVTAQAFFGDAAGLTNIPPGPGDSFGSHIATTAIDMQNNSLSNASVLNVGNSSFTSVLANLGGDIQIPTESSVNFKTNGGAYLKWSTPHGMLFGKSDPSNILELASPGLLNLYANTNEDGSGSFIPWIEMRDNVFGGGKILLLTGNGTDKGLLIQGSAGFASIGGSGDQPTHAFEVRGNGGLLVASSVTWGGGNTVIRESTALFGSSATAVDIITTGRFLGGTGNDLSDSIFSSILGGALNSLATGSNYSLISGGQSNSISGTLNYIGGGVSNSIGTGDVSDRCVIGGGSSNTIGITTARGTIGGGGSNFMDENTDNSTISGGLSNSIGLDSTASTVGGGSGNTIAQTAIRNTISGGLSNSIADICTSSVIGGGESNSLSNDSDLSVIAGGSLNTMGGDNLNCSIGGGLSNSIGNSARYSTIPGGQLNEIGASVLYGFAAGRRAKANHSGAFVWADSTDADVASSVDNEFTARATGGFRFSDGVSTATISGGTVTANAFVGDGSNLTNVPVIAGSTNYIQNRQTLQAGSTFYASSGSVAGTMTASTFTGSGYNITNATLYFSSAAMDTQNVNVLTSISVTTVTANLRGGRSVYGSIDVHAEIVSGTTKELMYAVFKNGVQIDFEYAVTIASGEEATLSMHWFEGTSTAGSVTYAIGIRSSATSGTQTISSRRITLEEH